MNLENLTIEDIQGMSYNEIIGVVKETNRPPGGFNSVVRIIQQTFIKEGSRVLDIGTSTGFTAIEIARLTGASVYGVDINDVSLSEARYRAALYGVSQITSFEEEDATSLSYENSIFDVVICGNVTSLIANKEAALSEYCRVTKTGGFIVAIPIYYVKKPSDVLVKNVEKAIHCKIEVLDRRFWLNFFNNEYLQISLLEDYVFDEIPETKVMEFVEIIMRREHLQNMLPDAKKLLSEQYHKYMMLFRENLSYMGYTIIFLRKEPSFVDSELFTSYRAIN